MNHITAGCRCGHRSSGNPTTVVREMQAHFIAAHDRDVPAEAIFALSQPLAPVAETPPAMNAPASSAGTPTSRVVLGRLVGVLGRKAKNPMVASLAGMLSEQLTGPAGRNTRVAPPAADEARHQPALEGERHIAMTE